MHPAEKEELPWGKAGPAGERQATWGRPILLRGEENPGSPGISTTWEGSVTGRYSATQSRSWMLASLSCWLLPSQGPARIGARGLMFYKWTQKPSFLSPPHCAAKPPAIFVSVPNGFVRSCWAWRGLSLLRLAPERVALLARLPVELVCTLLSLMGGSQGAQ